MSSKKREDKRIDIFVVEDHPAIVRAIEKEVGETLDIEFCGSESSISRGFRKIEEIKPDVVVVDISLEDGHGLDIIKNISSQFKDVEIIVFSMYDELVYAERALRMGAIGYLMKDEPLQELIKGIRVVNDGDVYLSEHMSSRILNIAVRGDSPDPGFPIDELTDRELAVFQMLGEGYSIDEIQNRLNIARKTVEAYRRRAKEKLGFESVSELLQYAVQWATAPGQEGERIGVQKEEK